MKITKEILRKSARLALEQEGYETDLAPGPGIVPGAQLNARKDGQILLVAVRTSLDREVGLLRTDNGKWRTIPKVDLVAVAVPAKDDQAAVEVLVFHKDVFIEFVNATVKIVEKDNKNRARFKAPIFIALDDSKKTRTREAREGLGSKAFLPAIIPLTHPALHKARLASQDSHAFIERAKREIAEYFGVDASNVKLRIDM
jgi:hypothetical protein